MSYILASRSIYFPTTILPISNKKPVAAPVWYCLFCIFKYYVTYSNRVTKILKWSSFLLTILVTSVVRIIIITFYVCNLFFSLYFLPTGYILSNCAILKKITTSLAGDIQSTNTYYQFTNVVTKEVSTLSIRGYFKTSWILFTQFFIGPNNMCSHLCPNCEVSPFTNTKQK